MFSIAVFKKSLSHSDTFVNEKGAYYFINVPLFPKSAGLRANRFLFSAFPENTALQNSARMVQLLQHYCTVVDFFCEKSRNYRGDFAKHNKGDVTVCPKKPSLP
ncbi:MAG: hypothetical protein ACI4I5_00245, partial [Acutalibacteraceae bacterium]